MTGEPKPSIIDGIIKLANSRIGLIFFITIWPAIVAALGLPSGAAKLALEAYEGTSVIKTECPPCPPCGD